MGAATSGMGRVDNTSRRWVPFCGLTPRFVGEPRSRSPIDEQAPWSLRSATDDVSFHLPGVPIWNDGGSVFQVGRSWNNSLIDTSARCPIAQLARLAGAGRWDAMVRVSDAAAPQPAAPAHLRAPGTRPRRSRPWTRRTTGRQTRRRVWRPRSRSRLRRSGRPGCRRALEPNRQRRNSHPANR